MTDEPRKLRLLEGTDEPCNMVLQLPTGETLTGIFEGSSGSWYGGMWLKGVFHPVGEKRVPNLYVGRTTEGG